MGYLRDIYTTDQLSPTHTDRYHYTTGYGYWVEGRAMNIAVGYVFGRKEAEGGGYTVEAGIEGIIDVIKCWKNYGLTPGNREWLVQQGYPQEYITFLHELLKDNVPLQVDVCKTSLFFPQEPVVRLKGPIVLIKMLESINLCIENGQCAYATHAARMTEVMEAPVASGAPKGAASVQGLRRGPAVGASFEASRGLAYGGYKSTSTGRAAELFGVKFAGTMDHAWVQTHDYQMNKEPGAPTMKDLFRMRDEGRIAELQEALSKDAFRSYAFTNLSNGTFLTDTYDTYEGIEDAITVMKELRELGLGQNYGMRFDSGDLVEFSKHALRRLADRNENGDLLNALPLSDNVSKLTHKDLLAYAGRSTDAPYCAASDGIDVHTVQEMRAAGAYVRAFGVGTAGSHVAPLGLVQKVSGMEMRPRKDGMPPEVIKLTPTMKIVSASPVKSSNPGMLNSRRFYGDDGKLSHIVIFDGDLGMDPENRVVNLRDFSDQSVNRGGARFEDILEPVFDKNGRYVYKEPPKKPAYPGSGYMVTDLEGRAARIKAELETLPDDVRRIHRPRKEVLQALLMSAFAAAQKAGQTSVTLNIADIEAQLPPEQAHIPIYLDHKLFVQRQECEQRHSRKPQAQGVGNYNERFEHAVN